MRKKTPMLDGRIEYDNWALFNKEKTPLAALYDPAYCLVRLCLFDLPKAAIVRITLHGEMCAWAGYYSSRDRVQVCVLKEQLGFTEQYRLRAGGQIQVEVYRTRASARARTPEHTITYRIDKKQHRPVRAAYQRANFSLEEELRKPPHQFFPPLIASAPLERGSLLSLCEPWASNPALLVDPPVQKAAPRVPRQRETRPPSKKRIDFSQFLSFFDVFPEIC